jgi:hypothetical protein
VSRTARDQLRDRADARFEDLGEHSVKNIARPVRVFRVVFDPTAEPEAQEKATPEAPAGPPPEDARKADSAEIVFWQSVQTSDDAAEYRIYLERYPDGAFAELARARLNGASAVETPAVELAFWETVRGTGNAAMLRSYLEKYPEGEFRKLAEIMLAELDARSA